MSSDERHERLVLAAAIEVALERKGDVWVCPVATFECGFNAVRRDLLDCAGANNAANRLVNARASQRVLLQVRADESCRPTIELALYERERQSQLPLEAEDEKTPLLSNVLAQLRDAVAEAARAQQRGIPIAPGRGSEAGASGDPVANSSDQSAMEDNASITGGSPEPGAANQSGGEDPCDGTPEPAPPHDDAKTAAARISSTADRVIRRMLGRRRPIATTIRLAGDEANFTLAAYLPTATEDPERLPIAGHGFVDYVADRTLRVMVVGRRGERIREVEASIPPHLRDRLLDAQLRRRLVFVELQPTTATTGAGALYTLMSVRICDETDGAPSLSM